MPNPFPLELGQLTIERVTNPGVGTNFTYSPSPRRIEQVIAVQYTLATDANVGTRRARLIVSDTTGQILRIGSDHTIIASRTEVWQFIGNIATLTDENTNYQSLPDHIILPVGGSLASEITAMEAGDQLSDIRIVLATWIRT